MDNDRHGRDKGCENVGVSRYRGWQDGLRDPSIHPGDSANFTDRHGSSQKQQDMDRNSAPILGRKNVSHYRQRHTHSDDERDPAQMNTVNRVRHPQNEARTNQIACGSPGVQSAHGIELGRMSLVEHYLLLV